MRYILLCAGKGTRLQPLTLSMPKCMFSLEKDYSILQRMIDGIKFYDQYADIVVVVGFMSDMIKSKITGVKFIDNPFFNDTNSIASIWFSKDYLKEDVTIINGDIIVEFNLIKDIITSKFDDSCVLLDSSIKTCGDYNVQVQDESVVVMSKELKNYFGEYAGITKIAKKDIKLFKNEINIMVNNGNYNQWYENALVQLIFSNNFCLKYKDISEYKWKECDTIEDLLASKEIHKNDNVKLRY